MPWYSVIVYTILIAAYSNECPVVAYDGHTEYNLQAFKYDFQIDNSDCNVQLHLRMTVDNIVISNGDFIRRNGWFHYQSHEPLANIPLFKMSAEVGTRYLIIAMLKDRNYELTGSVINEFATNGQLVKVFRIHRALKLEGYNLDYVFFVTNENGIIGSYCTIKGQQIIALRSGRIFEDVFDYSKFSKIDIR